MRLTSAIRNAIIDNALEKAGFPKRRAALVQKKAELTEELRVEILGGPEIVEALPEAIEAHLKTHGPVSRVVKHEVEPIVSDHLKLYNDGEHQWWWYDGRSSETKGAPKKLSPSGFSRVPKSLQKKVFRLEKEIDDLKAEERSTRQQLQAAVSSFTTDKKLLEFWPECAEFFPKASEVRQAGLPAIRAEDLNKIIQGGEG